MTGVIAHIADTARLRDHAARRYPVLFLVTESIRAASILALITILGQAVGFIFIAGDPMRRAAFIIGLGAVFALMTLVRIRLLSRYVHTDASAAGRLRND